MRLRTKPVYGGLLLGVAAVAALAPTLVSGSAKGAVGSGAAAVAANKPFLAQLNGANEVPTPGDVDGTGAATVTIDQVAGEVCVDLRVANIQTATAAHIHPGAAGATGAPLIVLNVPTATGSQTCVTTTPTIATDIATNPANFYINVHTADFPNGAIRGQLGSGGTKSGSVQLLNEPLRAYDSRINGDGVLNPLTTRTVSLALGADSAGVSKIAVPPGAIGAMIRLTVTATVNGGYLKVYSADLTAEPKTSNVNWTESGTDNGADTTVAVDALGRVKVSSGGGSTQFVIDVVGYLF